MDDLQPSDAAIADWRGWDNNFPNMSEALINLVKRYGRLLTLPEPYLARLPNDIRIRVSKKLPQASKGIKFSSKIVLTNRLSLLVRNQLVRELEGQVLGEPGQQLTWDLISSWLRQDLATTISYEIGPSGWENLEQADEWWYEVHELLILALFQAATGIGDLTAVNALEFWRNGWPVLGLDNGRLVIGGARKPSLVRRMVGYISWRVRRYRRSY